jgi:hypothetical protein
MYANIGKSIGSGIEEYKQNQERDRQAQGVISGILATNPDLLSTADPKTLKMWEKYKAGETGLKDNLFLAGWAATAQKGADEARKRQIEQMQLEQMQRQQAEQARQRQQVQLASQLANGVGTGVLTGNAQNRIQSDLQNNPFLQFSVQAHRAGVNPPSMGEILDYLAKTGTAKAQDGIEMSLGELAARYPNTQFDVTSKPTAKPGVVRVTGINTRAEPKPPSDTQVFPAGSVVRTKKPGGTYVDETIRAVPEVQYGKFYEDLSKEREKVVQAVNAGQAYEDVKRMATDPATKIISGAWATPELALKKLANYLGASYDEVKNTEVIRTRMAVPVLSMIKSLGANPSNADLIYMEAAVGGNITLDPAAIVKIAEIGEKWTKKTVDHYQKRVDEVFDPKSDVSGMRQYRSMLSVPSREGAAASQNLSIEDRLKRY